MSELTSGENTIPGCEYVLIIQQGDPNSHLPLGIAFGPFPSEEAVEDFINQFYTGINVIVNIYPLNSAFPESAAELDIDFFPDFNKKNKRFNWC